MKKKLLYTLLAVGAFVVYFKFIKTAEVPTVQGSEIVTEKEVTKVGPNLQEDAEFAEVADTQDKRNLQRKDSFKQDTDPEMISAMTTEEEDRDKIAATATGDDESEDIPLTVKKMEKGLNRQTRRERVIDFVHSGVKYFKKHALERALHKMSHSKEFIKGDLYLFVYDMKGNCFAHGQEPNLIWKNLYNLRDEFGAPIVKAMIERAQQGSGWITYHWRGATKVTYVESVEKDGKPFLVGSGYYPQSKRDAVVNLVKGAVALFNHIMTLGRPTSEAFSIFNYPLGRFVKGDLYLFALDFKGTIVANGDEPRLVGSNALEHRDKQGKYINKEIIQKLRNTTKGVWVEYISKNAPKVVYAEKVQDKEKNEYFIACGFYPGANRGAVLELVRRGYKFLKTNGLSQAKKEFTPRSREYRYGDLYLVVFNERGVCEANGGNPILVGRNLYDEIDQSGHYYVREIIQKAQEGGGWVNYKLKNSFISSYVENVNLGTDSYVILSSLFPVSKKETTLLLARSAASHYETKAKIQALRDFVQKDGPFIKGDLGIFVFDSEGICLANGDDYDYIWRNLLEAKDDNGKPYVKIFINTVRQGSGKVTYKLNGIDAVAFVEPVEKDGHLYVVGSSYYL